MRSSLAMTLVGFGTILLSFGAATVIITLLGARYGAHHNNGILIAALLVGGALLTGAGLMKERSRKD